MEPLELIGPLGIRRFHLAKTCQTHHGHEHNYDHDTIVIAGSVQMPEVTGDIVHGPGKVIHVPARVRHTVKALQPNTRYLCVYSHRDFDGLVSQEYVGNPDAYGHDRLIEHMPSTTIPIGLAR